MVLFSAFYGKTLRRRKVELFSPILSVFWLRLLIALPDQRRSFPFLVSPVHFGGGGGGGGEIRGFFI